MNKEVKQRNLLLILAGIVVIVVIAAVLVPQFLGEDDTASVQTPPSESAAPEGGGDIVIQADEIGTEASYIDYDADGINVQVLAVEASDGTVRLALNTCQVCNGSPYAYFVQEGDAFICQNCKNRFASTEIGVASGGCRPVPITEGIYTEQDGVITIPASFLDGNASLFKNWKNF